MLWLIRSVCADESLSGLSFNVIMSALLQRIVRNARRGSSGVAFFVAVGACARHSIFNDSIKEINSFYCLKNIRIFYSLQI